MTWRAAVLCAACCLSGCSEPAPSLADSGSFYAFSEGGLCETRVTLRAGKPVRGVNYLELTLLCDEDFVAAELASASALMPAHGHASPGEIVSRDPTDVIIDLFMAGRWIVTLEIIAGDSNDVITFPMDVP